MANIKAWLKPVKTLCGLWRRAPKIISGKTPVFAIGFSNWKQYMRKYFANYELIFLPKDISEAEFNLRYRALLLNHRRGAQVFIWGMRIQPFLQDFLQLHEFSLNYVEDGFIRSVQLGATKAPPMSLNIDSKTPYFDANKPSDLEILLQTYNFDADSLLMRRAEQAINRMINTSVSKYNTALPQIMQQVYGPKTGKRILVLGQVEDDASLRYGCDRPLTGNDLVRLAVAENPTAQIIYKPHPDVMFGYRDNKSNPNEVAGMCKVLTQDLSISDALYQVDQVYTITSLAGFEALLRGIKVTVLGCPFYAGWGLTDDRQPNRRRQRQLTLVQLFAGAYLRYPLYFHPDSGEQLNLEQVMDLIEQQRKIRAAQTLHSGEYMWQQFDQLWLQGGLNSVLPLARKAAKTELQPSVDAAVWLAETLQYTTGPTEATLQELQILITKLKLVPGISKKKLRCLKKVHVAMLVQAGDMTKAITKMHALTAKGQPLSLSLPMAVNASFYDAGVLNERWAKICSSAMQKTRQSQASIIKRLSDPTKCIAVVGHVDEYFQPFAGAEIEKHDIVVRFDNYAAEIANPALLGRRTDIWVRQEGYREIWRQDVAARTSVVFSGPDKRYHSANSIDAIELINAGVECAFIPTQIYADLAAILGYVPSGHLAFIYWLYQLRGGLVSEQVSLFGIANTNWHKVAVDFSKATLLTTASKLHNWREEGNFLAELVSESSGKTPEKRIISA